MNETEFANLINEFINYYSKEKARNVDEIVSITKVATELIKWYEKNKNNV